MPTVNVRLWAKQGTLSFPAGLSLPFWGFSLSKHGEPQLPGPEIRARVGDTINITLHNYLNEYVSLAFPGQEYDPKSNKGGVSDITAPFGWNFYSLTATRPGIFLYESSINSGIQVPMGLYGTILVHPKEVSKPNSRDYLTAYGYNTGTYFDWQKVLVFGEIDSRLNTEIAAGNSFNMLDYNPDYWIINGRAYPHTLLPSDADNFVSQPVSSKIEVASGQQVLIRCINAGLENHTFRLANITARVVAVDSWPLKRPDGSLDATFLKNTITIASGESYDLSFVAQEPGEYYLHDRDLNHITGTNHSFTGMMTRLDIAPSNI